MSSCEIFARKDGFEKTRIDLRESLRSVERLVKNEFITRGVSFKVSLPVDAIWVTGDSSRLQQVILNLANNARDAALNSPTSPSVSLSLSLSRYRARIWVKNNGPGIPLEIQRNIFDPYFTTKKRGSGTGLGLAICAQLIEQHQGRLVFSSEEENTVFVADIPSASEVEKAGLKFEVSMQLSGKQKQS